MNFTSAQRSASGTTAPQGAMSGEPPFDAAPLLMTSKMSLSVPPNLKSPCWKLRGGGTRVFADGAVACAGRAVAGLAVHLVDLGAVGGVGRSDLRGRVVGCETGRGRSEDDERSGESEKYAHEALQGG